MLIRDIKINIYFQYFHHHFDQTKKHFDMNKILLFLVSFFQNFEKTTFENIVYSKQSMYLILACFVNTRILSVYENIDSSICQKIISSDLFSGHHNVYESDSDQIISSNVDNNHVSNKLNNLSAQDTSFSTGVFYLKKFGK